MLKIRKGGLIFVEFKRKSLEFTCSKGKNTVRPFSAPNEELVLQLVRTLVAESLRMEVRDVSELPHVEEGQEDEEKAKVDKITHLRYQSHTCCHYEPKSK